MRFQLVTLCLCVFAGVVRADDARSTYLIKLLEGSSQFRVRAQAAISLGSVEKSLAARGALTAALRDVHPAVRAAAATSLGRIGDANDVIALRKLERDPEEPVRNAARTSIGRLETSSRSESVVEAPPPTGPARFYVAVGEPASRVPTLDRPTLAEARAFIRQRVAQIDGVRLAPDTESVQAAEKVLQRDRLKGFFLESSIVSVEKKPGGGTRVAVSVILATYPGRDMRAMMQGAATVTGSSSQIYRQAVEGAFSGALRQLSSALTH
ncbi:MAG TPA: HEAT repeat domain-containing protein [Polyangiales bacterium]|nr:HEAT repeat domain-containing protein [Polyangiales bacterium]